MTDTYPLCTTFLVVRHAESSANAEKTFAGQSDSPLTDRGHLQANSLAEALCDVSIEFIYSSDSSRAKSTAEPVARRLGKELVTTKELRERSMGVFTGMGFDEAKRTYPEVWARLVARDPDVAPEGGETHVQLAERARGVLETMTKKHRGRTVLLVSHGVTIHHLVRQLMGIRDLSLPLWLSVDNASITRVELHEPTEGVLVPRLAYANRVPNMEGRVIAM